jgi:hypothetical protein
MYFNQSTECAQEIVLECRYMQGNAYKPFHGCAMHLNKKIALAKKFANRMLTLAQRHPYKARLVALAARPRT